MPLPEAHLATLERYLGNHAADLTRLRASREALTADLRSRRPPGRRERTDRTAKQLAVVEAEIQAHEAIVALARDERVRDALALVAADGEAAREAVGSPRTFAASRGIALPRTMTITGAIDATTSQVRLEITNYDDAVPFVVIWTSDGGFSAPWLDR